MRTSVLAHRLLPPMARWHATTAAAANKSESARAGYPDAM
jgi:hypothetical protein